MKTTLFISFLSIIFSCGLNEIPEPSMTKELLVGDFLFVDTIGDSIYLNPKKSFNYNDTNSSSNGKNYKQFLKYYTKD